MDTVSPSDFDDLDPILSLHGEYLGALVHLSTESANCHNRDALRRILVAHLLASAEGTWALEQAVVATSLVWDRGVFDDVASVVAVRRYAPAMKALRECPYVQAHPTLRPGPMGETWDPKDRKPRPKCLNPDVLHARLRAQGLRPVVTYAAPTSSQPYTRNVLLVATDDGSFELVKETTDESDGPLGIRDVEHAMALDLDLCGHVTGTSRFLGFLRVEGETEGSYHYFFRRTFAFGRTVAETDWLDPVAICALGAAIARNLHSLHSRGYLYLDLRPANVLEDGTLFDLGNARRLYGATEVDTYLMDPMYAAPEVVLRRKAGRPTDIFSLGVLLHTLFTHGQHPFGRPTGDLDTERYAVPNALLPYARCPGVATAVTGLLTRMLAKDPKERPTAMEVATWFDNYLVGSTPTIAPQSRPPVTPVSDMPVALVPMRCGVPHKGHVNLITRLMDLGFFVQVSLQMTGTWSSEDPVPKWVVADMLRAAVAERGYTEDRWSVMYTRFETRQGQRMHFLLSPLWERVAVVVSGNPTVHDLLGPLCGDTIPLVFSQALCGDLTDANGTRLRAALHAHDMDTVVAMLPPAILRGWGVDKILSYFPPDGVSYKTPVDIRVVADGVARRVLPYESPLECLNRVSKDPGPWQYGGQEYTDGGNTLVVTYTKISEGTVAS